MTRKILLIIIFMIINSCSYPEMIRDELIYENILFSIIGGSKQEHEELKQKLNIKNVNINFIENTTQKKDYTRSKI